MRKLLVLTVIGSFLLGSNAFASQTTATEGTTADAIHKAAMNDAWTPYTPSAKSGEQTLYFKKKIKNKDYYTYRYQNRQQNKTMTVYVKVDYADDQVNVEFADKVRMNPGSLGVGNKVDNVLDELANAIEQELSANV